MSHGATAIRRQQFRPVLFDIALETPIVGFPVTTAEAKAYLRVDDTDQHAVIDGLIAAATTWAEGVTRRAFITRALAVRYESFPPVGVDMILDNPKVSTLTAVTYEDSDGVAQVITFATELDLEPLYGRVREAEGFSWPQGVRSTTWRYDAGYGDETAVPAQVKQAILIAVAQMFETRVDQPIGAQVSRPHNKASDALLQDFRVREL